MKTAVVYYSMSGNTQYVAEKVAQALQGDLVPLYPRKEYPDSGFRKFLWGGKSAVMGEMPALLSYGFEAEKYDRIILGSPVWAGTFAPPLRTFLHEQKDALQGKRIAAFACCSGGPGKVMEKLKAALGRDELESELLLIDPKDKPSQAAKDGIASFIEKLK